MEDQANFGRGVMVEDRLAILERSVNQLSACRLEEAKQGELSGDKIWRNEERVVRKSQPVVLQVDPAFRTTGDKESCGRSLGSRIRVIADGLSREQFKADLGAKIAVVWKNGNHSPLRKGQREELPTLTENDLHEIFAEVERCRSSLQPASTKRFPVES